MNFSTKPSKFPTAEELDNAILYYFELDNTADYPGSIFTESGQLCWRFKTHPSRSAYSPFNLFEKPVFVVFDAESQEILRIRKHTGAKHRFDIVQDGIVVGTIQKRGILRRSYTLNLVSGEVWTVRLPLFTLLFRAESVSGNAVWIRVGPSKKQWNVLTSAEGDDIRIISCIAFIHREWWLYR